MPPGDCTYGYTLAQVEELVADMDRFHRWFEGQTGALCMGEQCDEAHGLVVYRHDVSRYLRFRLGRHVLWD